ncbi:MAG: phytoene/squalene synthase family protein [Nitrolancea sp.]
MRESPPPASLAVAVDESRTSTRLDESARYCQELTRREAKNFYWGFIALPKSQRTAIYALYSFAREVDDAVDLVKATFDDDMLRPHRERLERCAAGIFDDPIMHLLSHAMAQYRIPRNEVEALIDGVAMDLTVKRYETWDDFRGYSKLVASAVGRMCVRVFGYTDPTALEYADELGVAMQLANMLRDVREDYERDRIYLPTEDLELHGVDERTIAEGVGGDAWEKLVHFEVARARGCFASGLLVTRYIPRRATACVFTMAGIYQAILDRIEMNPTVPLRERISLSSKDKLSVMAKSWAKAI